MRRPEVVTLPISRGDSLIVKKYLTAGEYRALLRAASKPIRVDADADVPTPANIQIEIDPVESGVATVLAYLLDWTFTDADGRPLVIREQPPDVVRAALDAIDGPDYMEVQRAILAHVGAVQREIAAEKKTPTPEPALVTT